MSTKLIVSCIGGAGALGGVVAGSYYLLNKEPEKTQQVTNTNSQQEETVREKTPLSNPKKTLKDALVGDGFVALNTTGREDDESWKILIKKYNSAGTDRAKITINGGLQDNLEDKNLANIQKLQKACSDLFAKTENYEGDKETARNWCNKESKLIKDQ